MKFVVLSLIINAPDPHPAELAFRQRGQIPATERDGDFGGIR